VITNYWKSISTTVTAEKNIGPGWANPPNTSNKGYIVENQHTAMLSRNGTITIDK